MVLLVGPAPGRLREGECVTRIQSGLYPKVFALATASLLGYALVQMVLPFAGPIFWALLLACSHRSRRRWAAPWGTGRGWPRFC
jgi:hypothetical protein